MRQLMKDIFFNDDQKQNHTVRLNKTSGGQMAEVHNNGKWKPIAVPAASDAMITTCRNNLLHGFDSATHMYNDEVMDFMTSLYDRKTVDPLKADIAAGLVKRSKQPSDTI